MATAVDISAPVCETREEQGGDLVDQATVILINKLSNEEQSQAHTDNGLSMVEGANFLTPPSIGEVHCEVNSSSPDVGLATEKPDQIVKDETDIVPFGKAKSDDQPTAIAVHEETSSGRIQQNVEESDSLVEDETKESKKHVSEGEEMYVQAETTYEKVGDVKPIEEDILEIPKSGFILENPAKSLHVAPENIEASILGQEKNMKSFPEDQSSNITPCENTAGETEEESIDAEDTQKEILKSLSTIASSSPEEVSINAIPLEASRDSTNEKIIDGTGTQKEVLENNFSNVSNEDVKGHSTERGEPRNVEFYENESTQSTVLETESKIEKSEDPLHATLEDINAPEIETSCIEEQSVTTHPQGIQDEKTEDEAIDADKMEGIIETVPTVVSIEKTEDNSCPKMENEDHLEKDAEQPSPVEDFTGNIVTDEIKIDDKNPSRAELLEEENTESALLNEEMQKEKPLESLHAVLEGIKPSDLDQDTESTSFLKEKSLTENPQEILGEETEEKTINAVSNEDNSEDSLIQVDAREMEQDAYLEKETEPSLTKASLDDATHDESINLAEPKIGDVHCEVNNSSPDVSMVTEKPDQIVTNEADIVPLGKPKSDDQPTAISVNEETSSGRIQQNVEESDGLNEEETMKSKTHTSTDEIVEDGKQTEEDILENPKSGNILENPAESLHVAPENIEASILGQERNKTRFPEDQSTNGTLHENVGGETEEKSIDEVDTRKEILESLPTIASSSPEEGSTNAVLLEVSSNCTSEKLIDGTGTQKEVLENVFSKVSNEDVKENSTEPRNVEFCENESTESAVLKIESKIETSADPEHATSEDINAPEIETSCTEEKSVATYPQGILDEKTEDEAVDAAEMEEISETVPTFVSIEKTEDNSCPQMENEDHLEKDSEKPSLLEDFTGNIVTDEVKIDDKNPSIAELLEEENTESASLKEEVQKEKPSESLHAVLEDIRPTDLDQHTETSFLEEKSLTENPQEILGEVTEEKKIDTVSNEDNGKDSLIQVDAREMEQGANLEKEVEPSLTKASVEDANVDLQNASEDHKASASSEDIETTRSQKEESLVMCDNTIDATNTEEMAHEVHNVTTEVQLEYTENSVTLVDCSQIEQEEYLERDGENSSWTEAPIVETKADESKSILEIENKGINSIKAELENEKDVESTLVKEGDVENPIDSLQTANQDIKASDSSQDTNNCIVEQLPTTNPEELSSDQTEREYVNAAEVKEESLEDIAKNIPDGNNADNTPTEEEGSQEPPLKDATMGNNNAEEPIIEHEAKPVGENEKITECTSVKEVSTESSALGQDEETSSLEEKSLTTNSQGIMDDTVDKSNGAIIAEEETPEDKENIGETTPYEDIEENVLVQEDNPQLEHKKDLENDSENTSVREVLIRETTEGSLDKEEAQVEKPIKSLQVPTEDIKASESCQETYSIDEKILSAGPEEIPSDKTEETTTNSAYTENENLELQNVENVPDEGSDYSQTEVEGPQKSSLEETSIGNNNDAESTITPDADENIVKADLLGNEESIECALVKEEVPLKSLQEEAQEEKLIDSSQAAREEIKASDSSQDTNCYIEEKSLIAYPQEITSDKAEKESIDAINRGEESIEVKDIPDGDDDVHSPVEDVSQKPYLKEATTRNDNDDESTITNEAQLVGENEKDIECALVKEEVSIELQQVAAQEIEVPSLGQDRETSSLDVQSVTTNLQGFMDETKDKTSGATAAAEETPEDKDVETTQYDDIEEKLLVEVDCKQAEQNEDSVNDSENSSLTEALIGNPGEGTLVKEEAHDEKHFESLQVATEDVEASDSCQETSSIEEKILTGDSQEISCDGIEEKTVDAAYNEKENLEEVATKIPNAIDEDDSPIQVDDLQKSPVEEASIVHEAKVADESKVTADLFQNETKTECGLINEEVSVKSLQVENEDIKPTASSQDREISHQKEEALKDKSNATSSHEDTIENSSIQVDCIQLEQNENLEKASESTSLTEAPTADIIENILVKEKAEEADHHIETLQVATEVMKASASCQEKSSIEEQILTGDSQENSCEKTEEKTTNSAYAGNESFEDAAISVPIGNNEDSSPIEVDGSQKPSLKEASMENTNDHESTISHDTEVADDLYENEKNIECDFVKEEASVKSLDVETEDSKATASNQDRESGHIEEQGLIRDPQGIKGEYKEDKIIDVTDLKEVTHEDNSNATISYENTTENSSVQVDCSQLEQNEHSEKDNETTSLTEALATYTTESALIKEEAQNEDHTDSLQVATEDIKTFSPCQDTETSSIEEQVLIADPEDISRDKIIEKTVDASDNEKTTAVQVENEDIKVTASSQDKETSNLEEQGLNTNPQGIMGDHNEDKTVDEDKSYATTSYEDSKESSFVQVDCLQLEQNEHSEKDGESTSLTEAPAADTIESTLVMEKVQDEDRIESLQAATEDVKAFAPSQDTKTSFAEEKIPTVDQEDISRDKKADHTIDASDKENTPEVQEKNTEAALKEDAYTASSQEATEDIKASNSSEDRDSHSQEEQILSANPEGLKDENRETETFPKDEVPKEIESVDFEARSIELKEEEGYLKDMSTAVNIAVHEEKDSDSIAVKLSCTKDLDAVDEVAVGHLAEDSDSKQEELSITEVPEVHTIISHENVPDVTSLASDVVEEANSCGDKTDTVKIAVLDDDDSMISTNETLPETDPRGGTEAETQVPDGEKEAELVQHDPTTEIDQKDIEGQLLFKDSQVISEPKGVNDEDEKTNLHDCKETSGSSNSGVLEEESTFDFQESRRETREEVENEEAQKQEKELHVSVPVHDSSSGKIENHVQEPEQAPLPASDGNIIEKTECNESEIVEDAIKNRERDDRTESFFNDEKVTEREQEETESGQEKITSDEKVQTTTPTSDLEAIDFHPILSSETSKVDHSVSEGKVAADREEQNIGQIASDGNEDTRIDNSRSITDLECKNDDEAPEIIQTTPSASEGQDVESMGVGETTALISECQRDGYEHANTISATEERPDSKEVVFEPEEQRSEYESKTQVLESVSQVQSCKIVAETEETKTEEKNLETAGETELEKVVAEDISGQEETKHETEILKTKEGDKDVEDYHQASHQEEVIIGSHLEAETNQEEEISTGSEDIKKENETEKVPKIFQEANAKDSEEPQENLLGKESIDRGLDQKEQLKSVQEVTTAIDTEEAQELDIGYVKTGAQNSNEEINRSTVAFPDEEENRTGADDSEKVIAGDEGMLNQNSKIPEIDAAAKEMPKELDENICEAPINTFHKTIADSEVNKEQQEEHSTRKDEILPLPELVQGKDSEKQNQKDEICGLDEVQPRDEQIVTHSEEKGEEESKGDTWNKPNDGEATETCVEPEHDFSFHIKDISEVPISDDAQVIPEDDESKNTSPGEECSNKSTQPQISTVSDDNELTEQASEATRITAEMQEPEVGINSQAAIPNATEVESRQVEEVNDRCKVVAETSTPVEPPVISTSKITLEVEDQPTKLHDFPRELNIMDTEVMAEKDDPENLQNVRDVSQDVQGSNEGSFEVSNKENLVEASPDENMKTSEEQETEEQKLGRAPGNATEAGVNCEEEKIINDKSNQLENSWSVETENVSESNTYRSLMDDTAQYDKLEGSPRQIDSLSILPEAKCSEIETRGKDIPAHFEGVNCTGVKQIEVTPLPSKVENANGNEKLSAECSQGVHELLEPSKVEQQAADCGNEVKTDQKTAEKPESKETKEPSLSDLFDVSMRKISKTAEHTAIDEEPATHTEDLHVGKPDEDQHENAKTEEENNDEDELSEQKRSELSSESPVMVDMADADVKVSHKKSHNILSGVGSKVKHSIAKVKKAITGKSSHPKPPSPKKTQVEK